MKAYGASYGLRHGKTVATVAMVTAALTNGADAVATDRGLYVSLSATTILFATTDRETAENLLARAQKGVPFTP